jgi:hypothetical protein
VEAAALQLWEGQPGCKSAQKRPGKQQGARGRGETQLPTDLLAEALLLPLNDKAGQLTVVLADAVAPVVSLALDQLRTAPRNLRQLMTVWGRGSWSGG